jgi:hypothetical protein
VPGAIDDAASFLQTHAETQDRLVKVSELVEGFESPFGLELLSTVHWVASREGAESLADILKMTYAWNERKRRFSERQIKVALDVLSQKEWIKTV